jgi:hypothetical protein
MGLGNVLETLIVLWTNLINLGVSLMLVLQMIRFRIFWIHMGWLILVSLVPPSLGQITGMAGILLEKDWIIVLFPLNGFIYSLYS